MSPSSAGLPRCVHIVDPMMVNSVGHHHHMVVDLRTELAGRGWDAKLYASRDCDSTIRAMAAAACFDHLPRIRIYPMPEADIGAVNYRFQQSLESLTPRIVPGDTVFVTLAGHRNLFGILGWLEAMEPERRPRVALMLAAAECFIDFEDTVHNRNSRIFQTVCRAIAGLFTGTGMPAPLFFTPSAFYTDHLASLFGPDVAIGSFPYSFQRSTGAVAVLAAPPLVGLFGNTGWVQKGLERFLEAAQILLAEREGVRFFTQIDFSLEPAATSASAGERLAGYRDVLDHSAVTVSSGPLEPADYDAQLGRCALAVLPYGPSYRRMHSGILFEALHRGRPVVLPAHSQVARDAAALGIAMPVFTEWSGAGVAAAIRDGLDHYPFYEAEARRASDLVDRLPSGGERLAALLTGTEGV
ncbi:glycosyltransferase family protein [Azospirillum agricola]|uniref:glycosyltransferase n=1 Tax=Azospirillum agricola TaxID=1720247 RepID=UPI001AE2B900|nr:glycosyltransferase [Azospirillum agricola]